MGDFLGSMLIFRGVFFLKKLNHNQKVHQVEEVVSIAKKNIKRHWKRWKKDVFHAKRVDPQVTGEPEKGWEFSLVVRAITLSVAATRHCHEGGNSPWKYRRKLYTPPKCWQVGWPPEKRKRHSKCTSCDWWHAQKSIVETVNFRAGNPLATRFLDTSRPHMLAFPKKNAKVSVHALRRGKKAISSFKCTSTWNTPTKYMLDWKKDRCLINLIIIWHPAIKSRTGIPFFPQKKKPEEKVWNSPGGVWGFQHLLLQSILWVDSSQIDAEDACSFGQPKTNFHAAPVGKPPGLYEIYHDFRKSLPLSLFLTINTRVFFHRIWKILLSKWMTMLPPTFQGVKSTTRLLANVFWKS